MSLVRPMIWVFFEVLLSLGLLHAGPAEPLVALGALDLRTPTTDEGNPHSAFRIWTGLGALLHVNLI